MKQAKIAVPDGFFDLEQQNKIEFKNTLHSKLYKMGEFRIRCEFGKGTKAGKEGKEFTTDYDNFIHHVMGYDFCENNHGYVTYSSRKDGLENKQLHRIIMDCPEGMVVDHIDRNKLNNCRSNLRIVTIHQNTMNKSKPKNNTSGVIGVNRKKKCKKWRAEIMLNNKSIHLGYFDTFEEACQARKEAEIKYFGEFRNKDNE